MSRKMKKGYEGRHIFAKAKIFPRGVGSKNLK